MIKLHVQLSTDSDNTFKNRVCLLYLDSG